MLDFYPDGRLICTCSNCENNIPTSATQIKEFNAGKPLPQLCPSCMQEIDAWTDQYTMADFY